MISARRELSELLPGEDLNTIALPEVASWISIYEELASVLRSVIDRGPARDLAGSTRRARRRRHRSQREHPRLRGEVAAPDPARS